MSRMSCILCCFLLLTGCAKTTVVLLPDDEGTVGQVVVQSAGKERVLSKAEQRVEATSESLSQITTMSPESVRKTFGAALKALPEKPESLIIMFDTESVRPTAESLPRLQEALANIDTRVSPSVELFGHTDHLGDRDYNQQLSDARAKEVRRLLMSRGVSEKIINVRGFGAQDPLFPPVPGKAEPRNRRVEIFIR